MIKDEQSGLLYSITETNSLRNEIKKLKLTNGVLEKRNKKLNQMLNNPKKIDDYTYLSELQDSFNKTLDILKEENRELNNVVLGLRNEIKYYQNKLK